MTRFQASTTRLACTLFVLSLGGCSVIDAVTGSDKVDYRTGARQTQGLDVPPDLSQLNADRGPTKTVFTASELSAQKGAVRTDNAATGVTGVAPNTVADLQLVREADGLVLVAGRSPDLLWTKVREFWLDAGFTIEVDRPELGLIETSWAENRAKLPQDFIRRSIGQVFSNLYSTGERDQYRIRVERTDKGAEIRVYHRGMQEVYTNAQKDTTVWQPRARDTSLEGEMLSRLMMKLGGREDDAKASLARVSGETATPVRKALTAEGTTRPLSEVPNQLLVAEDFDRAWRRVGQSLDRHGFTIEDRDRKQGLFFLRYADPTYVGKEEPGFFAKLFGNDKAITANRYRVSVKSDGKSSTVMVTDSQGNQQTDDNAKRILQLLQDDLR